MPPTLKRPYLWLTPFAVVALAFHLSTALRYGSGISGADGQWYWDETALFGESTGLFDERQFSRSYQYPGFIAFAGGLRALLGAETPVFIYVANTFMFIALAYFVCAVGRWAFNDVVGVIAGAMTMWVPSLAWAMPTIGYEVLFVFLVFASMAVMVAAFRQQKFFVGRQVLLATISSLLLFGAFFTVSKAVVLLPVLLVFVWRQLGKVPTAVYASVFGLGLIALGLRNLVTHGVFFFTSLNSGATLWLSNNPEATGLYMDPPWIPGVGIENDIVQVHPSFGTPVNLYNDLFTQAAINWIIRNPADFTYLLWAKLGETFAPISVEAARSPIQVSGLIDLVVPLTHFAVLLLALFGVTVWAWSRPKIWSSPSLVFWSGMALIVATMPFHGSARYQSAFMPMILLFAVAGGQALWLRWRTRSSQLVASNRPDA